MMPSGFFFQPSQRTRISRFDQASIPNAHIVSPEKAHATSFNPSPIVMLFGADSPNINFERLYNLFSNYGNVLKVSNTHYVILSVYFR
jgi:RNA recognition motif-containing protein